MLRCVWKLQRSITGYCSGRQTQGRVHMQSACASMAVLIAISQHLCMFCQWASVVAQIGRVCLQCRRACFDPWVGNVRWRRAWQPTPVFLPWKSYGQRSLVGYSLLDRKESDMTEWLSLSITKEDVVVLVLGLPYFQKQSILCKYPQLPPWT